MMRGVLGQPCDGASGGIAEDVEAGACRVRRHEEVYTSGKEIDVDGVV